MPLNYGAEMQAAGVENPYYLAQILTTFGDPNEDSVKKAYKLLGLNVPGASEVKAPEAPEAKESTPSESGGEGKSVGDVSPQGAYGPAGLSSLGTLGSLSSTLGGLIGGVAPGLASALGPIGTMLGMTAAIDALASMLGASRGYDVSSAVKSMGEIQSTRDLQGAFAGDEAQAARDQALADYNATVAQDLSGLLDYGNPKQPGVTPGGFVGNRAPEASVANPDIGDISGYGPTSGALGPGDPSQSERSASMSEAAAGYSGGVMGGETQSGGPGGPGGTDQGGGGYGSAGSGEGGPLARGGVRKVSKPTRFTAGEKGKETLVAVPEKMKQSGRQGPEEDQVILALEELLTQLKGSRNV